MNEPNQEGGQPMTLRELSQLYYLNREIAADKARLAELEAAALPGGQAFSGMPHATGAPDLVGRYAAEIADLRDIIAGKLRRCMAERARLERYIADCDDPVVREIFQLRFVDGLPWEQVAASTTSRMMPSSCRKACYRYLQKKIKVVTHCHTISCYTGSIGCQANRGRPFFMPTKGDADHEPIVQAGLPANPSKPLRALPLERLALSRGQGLRPGKVRVPPEGRGAAWRS